MNNKPKFSVIIPTYNRLALLQQCVESLIAQRTDPADYEIIVVNDGSTDATSPWLHSAPYNGRVRFVEVPNGGPTRARNSGAQIALGNVFVFTDDDCTHPPTWLNDIAHQLKTQGAVAVGGTVVNKIVHNDLTEVYEVTNRLLAKRLNNEEGKARFLTTNNFAILRSAFEKYGNFDDRFFTGAEDRELVARLIAAGERVMYSQDIAVDHYHDFTLREFLFLLYRQGRGSYLYYNVMGKEKKLGVKPLSFREYLTLINTVSQDTSILRRIKKGGLAFLAQCFVLLGYISATWEGVTDLSKERSEHSKSAGSGARGTMFGLLSFLGGTVFSSAFGFFSFVIIGRALSIPDFGIFMVAFSLETLLSSIINLGLPNSVIRFASEYFKNGDEDTANSIVKTGLALQTLFVIVIGTIGIFVADSLMSSMMKVTLPPSMLTAVVVGAVGAIFYNYTTIVYSIHLRFIDLTVLRSIVSIVRFVSILALSLFSLATPLNLFWAFIIPYWLGLTISLTAMLNSVHKKGTIQPSFFKRILAYGGWTTANTVSRLVTTHVGALILATYTSKLEVGTYGLGQTLSFVYGVISITVSQYFMPIGARVKSNADIIPFVRRTLRLAIPLVIVSLISLVFAYPVMSLMYGESRTVAVPVFVLLSLSILAGTSFVSVNVLFHYFFKPYYIALETALRAILFLSGSFLIAHSTGAIGVAAVYLGANLIAQAVSFLLLAREFKRRGVSLEPRVWKTFGFSSAENND